eukprot:15458483-Alexandrium_andersonii.AAC.1
MLLDVRKCLGMVRAGCQLWDVLLSWWSEQGASRRLQMHQLDRPVRSASRSGGGQELWGGRLVRCPDWAEKGIPRVAAPASTWRHGLARVCAVVHAVLSLTSCGFVKRVAGAAQAVGQSGRVARGLPSSLASSVAGRAEARAGQFCSA